MSHAFKGGPISTRSHGHGFYISDFAQGSRLPGSRARARAMAAAWLLPLTAASDECTSAVAASCLVSRCTESVCSRCDNECGAATSSAALGRGWGAGGINVAFGGASECLLGVVTQHPNPTGFRVTLEHWAQGALLTWVFDAPVILAKTWGSVRAVPVTTDRALSFRLLQPPLPRSLDDGRTDQWGFVLATPFTGQEWRVDCGGAVAPPAPPAPPLTLPPVSLEPAAPAEEGSVVEAEAEEGEYSTGHGRRRRGKGKGKGKGKGRRAARRKRRRRRQARNAAQTEDETG